MTAVKSAADEIEQRKPVFEGQSFMRSQAMSTDRSRRSIAGAALRKPVANASSQRRWSTGCRRLSESYRIDPIAPARDVALTREMRHRRIAELNRVITAQVAARSNRHIAACLDMSGRRGMWHEAGSAAATFRRNDSGARLR